MKQVIIQLEESKPEEGLFLVNPTWIHLNEKEVQDKIEEGQKLFKVNFEEIK